MVECYKSGILYFFLDEIQNVDDFTRDLRGFQDLYCHCNRGAQVVISGSRYDVLSSTSSASVLVGRTISIELTPFSYSEFLFALNLGVSLESFQLYANWGGFPGAIEKRKEDETLARRYLVHQVLEDIIQRDIGDNFTNWSKILNLLTGKEGRLAVTDTAIVTSFEKLGLLRVSGNTCFPVDPGLWNQYLRSAESLLLDIHPQTYESIVFWYLAQQRKPLHFDKKYQILRVARS
jgi:predicted AAA+ superfamily ATPase